MSNPCKCAVCELQHLAHHPTKSNPMSPDTLEQRIRKVWKPSRAAVLAAIERHKPQQIGSPERVALVLTAAYRADAPDIARALEAVIYDLTVWLESNDLQADTIRRVARAAFIVALSEDK